ncbi:MAG: hypothetical protein HZB51_32305 [Chloroflexi bacterium]|nr:hypothetical protein [Chloroflexota bacterium]
MTRRKPHLTYRQVLENVKALPLADQDRLWAELAKTRRVYIMRPTGSPAAIRRGRRLAAEIRKELASKQTGTLEETMIRLRGRSWSS